ncbi:hypothetical protein K8R03_03455 [Candidatus Kaiserbacteria bacterium]|nr:hypothetical protein [Candidatus Kaiserbacteria bacterium]
MVQQSTYRLATIASVVVVAALIIGLIVYNKGFGDYSSHARTTVQEFGALMQNVSLLSPDASTTIATVYGPYAIPELIAQWQKDPEHAPGRLTSSPWPDHITIKSITKQGSGYIVSGEVALMTSDGPAGTTPVVIQVVPVDGVWLIAAYQEQVTS